MGETWAPGSRIHSPDTDEDFMKRQSLWLVGVAFIGMMATVVAGCLLWFVVTNPVAVARLLSRGL